MTVGSRRVVFYWLLLLLPTLAAGGGALWLVQREQARLDAQARVASESRRAAIEARARLIAESVELLVGDVETSLMATLREVPASGADEFLDAWEKSNPLVRGTFRLARNDQLLRPAPASPHDAMRAWLNAWVASGPPWRAASRKEEAESVSDRQLRRDVSANVSQVQNARTAIKDVAGLKNNLEKSQGESAIERSGWTPWRDGHALHLVGWRLPNFSGVVGIEIELKAIESRLGDLLPKDGDLVDAFAIREIGGATLQSKVYQTRDSWRTANAGQATITVPISANVLPGWEVAGFVQDDRAIGGGSIFFVIGALLVGIFVIAILSGGSLLLWQARRSEAEAVQKTSFVANVSHEFKTPLTTIRLYAELLEQGRVRDAAQEDEYLRTIGRETGRLARLVNNVLDFSQLEQGKKKYARERFDLAAELTRLLDTHAPRIAEANLALRIELPPEPVRVTSDRDAFGQIVLNLIDNACKYASAGGEVVVSLGRRGAGAEVHVADRGPGVPAEHRDQIFEKFHRVDDALTSEKTGAGLGLSIARQLARGLGGDIRFESRTGGGADFILTLP